MKDAKRPLEVTVENALSALDIYDVAPVDATYPFTEFGETVEIEDMDKDHFGSEIIITFYIRDRFRGSVGSRQAINNIKNTILTTLRTFPSGYPSMDDFKITGIRIETSDFQKVADDTYLYFTEILRLNFRLYQLNT